MSFFYDNEVDRERYSQDRNVNSFGRSLLDMCSTLNLKIVNGNFVDINNNGAFTYICHI